MKSKLTIAMKGALSVLAAKTVATFAELSAAGGSGSSLSNLVNNKLAKRVDKNGEKLWSITGDGRKALKSGEYTKLNAEAPKAVEQSSSSKPAAKASPARPVAKATARKPKAAKVSPKRQLAGAR